MSYPNFLLENKDVVMKKKILSVREHYDFEDLKGAQLGSTEADFFQVPPKFVVVDNHGQEVIASRRKNRLITKRIHFLR